MRTYVKNVFIVVMILQIYVIALLLTRMVLSIVLNLRKVTQVVKQLAIVQSKLAGMELVFKSLKFRWRRKLCPLFKTMLALLPSYFSKDIQKETININFAFMMKVLQTILGGLIIPLYKQPLFLSPLLLFQNCVIPPIKLAVLELVKQSKWTIQVTTNKFNVVSSFWNLKNDGIASVFFPYVISKRN